MKQDLEKETTAEALIAPEARLAVCLYRLVRGDYLHTAAELTGLGSSMVGEIVKEVSFTIVHHLWHKVFAWSVFIYQQSNVQILHSEFVDVDCQDVFSLCP